MAKTVWRFLTKLSILLPYNPITLLDIYLKKMKTCSHKYLYTDVIAALLQLPKLGNNQDTLQ